MSTSTSTPKYRFFDLDGTICESRQVVSPEMKAKLLELKEPIIVVSGAERKRLLKQMDGVPCYYMAQNGNHTKDWYNLLTENEKKEIFEHLWQIEKFLELSVIGKDTVHDRGCQVSFSFTGHDAPIIWKRKFDPKKRYRKYVLENVPFKSKSLIVRIAGTTCFDYNRKRNLKGDNIKRYLKLMRIKAEDCIYYGDNFDKGGNDESVLGIMKCVRVKGPEDLMKKL